MLRTAGQMAAKVKGMAREFQRSMEEAAREADLDGIADAVKKGTDLKKGFNVQNQIVDSVKEFEKTVKTEMTEVKTAVDKSGGTPEFTKPWVADKTDKSSDSDAAPAEDDPGQVQAEPEAPKVKADTPQAEPEAAKAAAKEPKQKSA